MENILYYIARCVHLLVGDGNTNENQQFETAREKK
jgi:hypothetical protein